MQDNASIFPHPHMTKLYLAHSFSPRRQKCPGMACPGNEPPWATPSAPQIFWRFHPYVPKDRTGPPPEKHRKTMKNWASLHMGDSDLAQFSQFLVLFIVKRWINSEKPWLHGTGFQILGLSPGWKSRAMTLGDPQQPTCHSHLYGGRRESQVVTTIQGVFGSDILREAKPAPKTFPGVTHDWDDLQRSPNGCRDESFLIGFTTWPIRVPTTNRMAS